MKNFKKLSNTVERNKNEFENLWKNFREFFNIPSNTEWYDEEIYEALGKKKVYPLLYVDKKYQCTLWLVYENGERELASSFDWSGSDEYFRKEVLSEEFIIFKPAKETPGESQKVIYQDIYDYDSDVQFYGNEDDDDSVSLGILANAGADYLLPNVEVRVISDF